MAVRPGRSRRSRGVQHPGWPGFDERPRAVDLGAPLGGNSYLVITHTQLLDGKRCRHIPHVTAATRHQHRAAAPPWAARGRQRSAHRLDTAGSTHVGHVRRGCNDFFPRRRADGSAARALLRARAACRGTRRRRRRRAARGGGDRLLSPRPPPSPPPPSAPPPPPLTLSRTR